MAQTCKAFEAVGYLLANEVGNVYNAIAFSGFWAGYDISAFKPLIRLVNAERFLFGVKVGASEHKQFALSYTAPVKNFKSLVIHGFVHHNLGELQVFLFRPEFHFGVTDCHHISHYKVGFDFKP